MNTKLTPQQQMDALFAPDISVKVDADGRIYHYHAITMLGAKFILKQSLLGMDYDEALFLSNGLVFETIESDQKIT